MMVSDSNTAISTPKSVKVHVDSQLTARDLDFQADSGGKKLSSRSGQSITSIAGTDNQILQ